MKKLLLILFLIISFSTVFAESSSELYSLEIVNISGNVENNELLINGYGKVLKGNSVKIYLLGPSDEILIKDLRVNNSPERVSFDEKGYYFVANKSFNFSAKIQLLGLGQASLFVPGPVNQLFFDISNGYVVGGNKHYGLLNENIVIQRDEETALLVEGDFHYLIEDKKSFTYKIDFQSYGEGLSTYSLNLLNNEDIVSVVGALDYEVRDNVLELDLSGSSATVIIKGFFEKNYLKIPLRNDSHDILIESEAEKKITISTSAESIDLSESSITPKYSNARAYLAEYNDFFSINVQDLTLLPSLVFSVDYAYNEIAVDEKGSVLGELRYSYANTGQDYLRMSIPGTPLYAATGEGAVKLTTDEANKSMLLALPKTNYGILELVYFKTRKPLSFFNSINLPLVNTTAPVSEMSTSIYLPSHYYVVYTFGAEGGSELPSLGSIIFFLAVVIFTGYFMKKDVMFVTYYVLANIGLFILSPIIFIISIIVSIFLIIKKIVKPGVFRWVMIGGFGLLLISLLLIFLSGFAISPVMQTVSYSGGRDVMQEASAPSMKGLSTIGEGEGKITVPTETGLLPVKFEIPSMGKSVRVTNYLVTVENPVSLRMIVINSRIKYLYYLLTILFLVKIYRMYFVKKK